MTYVALLRGISVGGNALVKMADLKKTFVGTKLYSQMTVRNPNTVRKLHALMQPGERSNPIGSR